MWRAHYIVPVKKKEAKTWSGETSNQVQVLSHNASSNWEFPKLGSTIQNQQQAEISRNAVRRDTKHNRYVHSQEGSNKNSVRKI